MLDYVIEAFSSLLSYSNQDELKIIVVNEGSNDQNYTKRVFDSFALNNLKVLHQEKKIEKARNIIIRISKAPYLLNLDSDIKINSEYIEKEISILDSNLEIEVVAGNYKQFGLRDEHIIIGDFFKTKLIKCK